MKRESKVAIYFSSALELYSSLIRLKSKSASAEAIPIGPIGCKAASANDAQGLVLEPCTAPTARRLSDPFKHSQTGAPPQP